MLRIPYLRLSYLTGVQLHTGEVEASYDATQPTTLSLRLLVRRVGLKAAKIIPDIIDRVSPASAAELEVAFHGKAIQVGWLCTQCAQPRLL